MRSFLLTTHRYSGLLLGLVLAVTGLSGSIIVFDRELDELIDPAIADFPTAQNVGDLNLAFENANQAVSNGTAPTRIALGRDNSAPHIIRFPTPEGAAGPIEVTINPNNSEVTAVRIWGEYPVTWFYKFHYSFLAGEAGETVVGILGLFLLFFCVSGLIIWWPKFGFKSFRQLQRAFSVRFGAGAVPVNYDLHRVLGVVSLPVLLVVAFTGVELVWHEPVESLVSVILPVEAQPSPVSVQTNGAVDANQVYQSALQTFPDARVLRIYLPGSPTDTYQVSLIRAGDLWREFGATQVWIDQYSGEVLDKWDSKNLASGNSFLEWMFPLHNGDGLGLVGRSLVFITGLLPTFFFATGFYLWLRRRRAVEKS